MRNVARGALVLAALGIPAAASAQYERGLILSSPEAAASAELEVYRDLSITVDVSERMMYVRNGDDLVRQYPVSVGTSDYPTPTGTFRVRKMIWNPSWTPPASAWARDDEYQPPGSPGNPMGRVKIFFQEPDYYIHGTGLAGSLGNARSHGCIRMRNTDAVELARLIMLRADPEKPTSWFRETIENRTTSREVVMSTPTPLRVRP